MKFTFTIECEVELGLDHVWPDGDAPAKPTAEEAAKVVEKCGGLSCVIRDWGLDHDMTMTIVDSDGGVATVTL